MKSIRKLLLKILGLKYYLSILSAVYLYLVKKGLLKKKYPELFYLEKIIKQGDVCIDIGANLAYYSWFMSKYCGAAGNLIAIEPVPLFAEIWRKNMKSTRYENFRLENCALGAENKKVLMQTPEIDGVLHHGMTHIVDNNSQKQKHSYEVDMKVPDEIFVNLKKLNFVKIDVEGYEHLVLENMQETIEKFYPIIQAELSGEQNRKKVINMLTNMNYEVFVLTNFSLQNAQAFDIQSGSKDFYFLPKENLKND